MSLAKFVESLVIGKFGNIPTGHVRMHPSLHSEIGKNIGEVKQLGMVKGVRYYADPAIPEGQARLIDSEGRIAIIMVGEEEVEQKTPAKKKPGRKRKTRTVHTRPSKANRV